MICIVVVLFADDDDQLKSFCNNFHDLEQRFGVSTSRIFQELPDQAESTGTSIPTKDNSNPQ